MPYKAHHTSPSGFSSLALLLVHSFLLQLRRDLPPPVNMPSTFLLPLGLLLPLLHLLICLGEGNLAIDDRIANPVTGRRLLWEKVPEKDDDKKDATKKVTSETTTEAESPAEEPDSTNPEQNVSLRKSASKSGKRQEEKTTSSNVREPATDTSPWSRGNLIRHSRLDHAGGILWHRSIATPFGNWQSTNSTSIVHRAPGSRRISIDEGESSGEGSTSSSDSDATSGSGGQD